MSCQLGVRGTALALDRLNFPPLKGAKVSLGGETLVSHKWLHLTKNSLPRQSLCKTKKLPKQLDLDNKRIQEICNGWSIRVIAKKWKEKKNNQDHYVLIYPKYLGSEYMLPKFPRLGDKDRFEVSG